MESIGSVTKNDTPCELFSDTIMGQLEELEGHICDILGAEAVAYVKVYVNSIQAACGKETDKIQLWNIWVGSEELVSKDIDKNTKICNHHADNSLSQQLSTNDRIPWYRRINSVFFTETVRRDLNMTNAPMVLCDYCLERQAQIHNAVPNSLFQNQEMTPHESTFGKQGNILNICNFGWYQWIYYRKPKSFPATK